MKKILYIALALSFGTLFQSCDPMKDIYTELDQNAIDKSGIQDLEFEMTKSEYDLLRGVENASTPFANQYFNSEDSAKVLIPVILSKKFQYLGEKSTAKVTYNLGNRNLKLSTIYPYKADDATYVAVTGGTRFKNFNSEAQILAGVKYFHKTPKQGDWVKITYIWSATNTETTSSVIYLNGNWYVSYELLAADYTAMQQGFANFSVKETAELYLPVFMKAKYPYILTEGYTLPVIYILRLSSSNINPTVALMKYQGGQWVVNSGSDKALMQFAVTKGVWLADNTIKYTITADEHRNEVSKYVDDAAAKASIAQYGNFDLKLFTSRAMLLSALTKFTKAKFPNSAVGQRYLLTYRTFNPNSTATIWLELGEDGNYVEKLD
ncbi:hypothetical protein [Sphingobacterium bovistauri]|uniref:DUF5017 domain-containing protein n=1 Tax=Sphingobacterium bovistauri TaxID=2781959 RepID=A0ABS7Z3U8_9SPHI|nr:hypothetical protein [Sphingobacterium bovistauri]MCA5004834.1 hypothetical protein [Sphingobacterium bovistauri]